MGLIRLFAVNCYAWQGCGERGFNKCPRNLNFYEGVRK